MAKKSRVTFRRHPASSAKSKSSCVGYAALFPISGILAIVRYWVSGDTLSDRSATMAFSPEHPTGSEHGPDTDR
jgi:hypothetical protein